MTGDLVEVAVLVEKRGVGPHRDRGDQTVWERPDRRYLPPARAVQRRSDLVVRGFLEREEAAAVQEPTKVAGVAFVVRAGKELEDDEPRGGERLVRCDRSLEPVVDGTAGRTLVLDPGRGIDEDHDERG